MRDQNKRVFRAKTASRELLTTQLREGIVERKPKVTLSGEVECDEAYVVAGHKGKPEEVKKKSGPGAAVG